MGLETGTTINDLNADWPYGSDDPKIGHQHINLVKAVLKNQFPGELGQGFDQQILATSEEWNHLAGVTGNIQAQLDALGTAEVALGSIIMYSGTVANIPSNFSICNGTGGTPYMIDKFVLGTATEANINSTGGTANSTLAEHTHYPSHAHSVFSTSTGNHTHSVTDNSGGAFSNPVCYVGTNYATVDTVQDATDYAGAHTHNVTVSSATITLGTTGDSLTNTNNPAYLKLAYIMRMS